MKTTNEQQKIMVNVWGEQKEALLTTCAEIEKLGFELRSRAFGSLNDGTQALFFNAACQFGQQPNNGIDQWYVSTETIEELTK